MERPNLEKPLKILTLDGGGLQAISPLLILDKLLDTIQETNRAAKKPRPCDVFDVIAGIGAGGWLALLLGRFQLDVKACLREWYKLIQCIAPRSRSQGIRRRVLTHSYFDKNLLAKRIDRLIELYGTGDEKSHGSRDADAYNLFRTYNVPNYNDPSRPKFVPGPSDPASFGITSAFGVTGAARYFSAPWKEENMVDDRNVSFLDGGFPKPHNITRLALQEMWALYGNEAQISVIVNIGPGSPTDADFSLIARRFSWGRNSTSPSLVANGPRNKKLREKESNLVTEIRQQLQQHYKNSSEVPPYYRLSMDIAPLGTAQNDAQDPGTILDATVAHCDSPKISTSMDEISRRIEVTAGQWL